jgi:hypothetical protein
MKIRHPRQQGVVFAPLLIFFGGEDVKTDQHKQHA